MRQGLTAAGRYAAWEKDGVPILAADSTGQLVEHRSVYACRHTFASWSIRAGVQLFYLSRVMGTSVAQIDATYGHLVPDSEEYLRSLLDDFDAEPSDRLTGCGD